MRYTIKDIQKKLNLLGFSAGPVDGIRGKKTIAAIKAFQLSRAIRADGIVGPKTLQELFPEDDKPVTPDSWPWLTEAMRVYGYHEVYQNAELKQFLKSDGKTLGDPAKLPWCGDFVETCILRSLPREPVPANPYWARSWRTFGVYTEPRVGAIMVFERGQESGHVGFYVGETASSFVILGGNQSNRVKKSRIAKSRLISSRWPRSVDVPGKPSRLIIKGDNITETTNEE